MLKVDGVPRGVCEECGLPGAKAWVEGRNGRTREYLLKWAELDLTRAQRLADDAEFLIRDAEEALPDRWQEVSGNCRLARSKAGGGLRRVQEDIINLLLEKIEENLQKAGHIKSAKRKKAEREKEQGSHDSLREKIEVGVKVAKQSLADSQNRELKLRGEDRQNLLHDAVRQATQAYFRSVSYLERKTDVGVDRLVEAKLPQGPVVGGEDEEALVEEVSPGGEATGADEAAAVEEEAGEEQVEV
ncbi:MAG TPA: hypothetical protein VF303_00200 [Candidatus Nanoarchaeia archaeon]